MICIRYNVDEVFALMYGLNKGWGYDAALNRMVYNKLSPDIDLPDYVRTFKELLRIGNTIDPIIQ